jgi:hypothetical protein
MLNLLEKHSARVEGLRTEVTRHRIYARVQDAATLAIFMEHHVFCVWDFQSLLKSLQRALTCIDVPWHPSGDPEARRLINEIVLEEESDEGPDGSYLSHFELYIQAMTACGATTAPILGLLRNLKAGLSCTDALRALNVPPAIERFVAHTIELASTAPVHRVLGVFTLGREELVPKMFEQMVRQLAADAPSEWGKFLYYLNRHIDRDGNRHGPMSKRLLEKTCGDSELLWKESIDAAAVALENRLQLWDAVVEAIDLS